MAKKRLAVRTTTAAPEVETDIRFVTHAELTLGDTTYRKGDPIHIDGMRGPFTFHYASYNADGDAAVTVWWEGHHFRAFSAERIVAPGAAKANLCPDHPHYSAARRPRTDCARCAAAYASKHPERVQT